ATIDPRSINPKQGALILLNPATARPGSSIGVTGTGFDAGATVTFVLKRKKDDQGIDLGFTQADKGGNISGYTFTLPQEVAGGTFTIEARQDGAGKTASATGNAVANSPEIKFGAQVGKPGDQISISAKGFSPKEVVSVHLNSLNSDPIGTIETDESGGVYQATLEVPFGAVGNNSFIFMGEKSQSPVSVPFLMLNLYPVLDLSSYASKADEVLSFSAEGFGPRERVRIYLNDLNSPPVAIVEADQSGSFKNEGGFLIPYDLKGKNTIIAMGEQSMAPTTVSFDVLPYSPNAEASTYGGKPGTIVSFYGAGFGRNEIVRVYVGMSEQSAGKEVTCGKSDDEGNLLAAGSYRIPGDVEAGQLDFTLVGDKTQVPAKASMEVMAAGGPVTIPPDDKPYVCQYDEEERLRQEEEKRKAEEAQKTAEALAQPPTPSEGTPPGNPPGAQSESTPPAAAPSPRSTVAVVSNTEGEGVSVRQEPNGGDKLAVWPDGTRLDLAGETRDVDGQTWVKVKDPAGNEGWVPAKYLAPSGQ
ncbi:MAG: SH3 domain-containing protein, partial [Chloroflexi bacterium]|nr:SH3 domain-containing protein [Chloroflexota bacterium]